VDRRIARLAAAQRGVVARRQLLALGLSSTAITLRVRSGRLHLLHRGVYAVGHPALAEFGREQAALLACGPDAVLSHHSAAAVWRLLPSPQPEHVTVVRRSRGPATVRVHQATVLPRHDVRVREGLRITAPARTLVDLAGVDGPAFEAALNEALVRRMVPRSELDAAAASGRRGAGRLRAALDAGPAPTRSGLERRLLVLLARAGLPRPQTNARVGRWEVDAAWPEARVVAELDGYASHTTRRAFEADRLRDGELQALGWRTLRLTHRQLAERPEAVAGRLGAELAG
jgi:very-short-patch-repair endonuclease